MVLDVTYCLLGEVMHIGQIDHRLHLSHQSRITSYNVCYTKLLRMLDFRLKAYNHWLTMKKPEWAHLNIPEIDFQEIIFYAAPKSKPQLDSLDDVDPRITSYNVCYTKLLRFSNSYLQRKRLHT